MLGVLFMVLISKAHVNHVKSDLKLKMWNNSSFNVILDHQKFTKTNNLHLDNLTPGYHSLKIVRIKKNRYGNGGFKQVLFNGTIKIPKRSRVVATITRDRNLRIHVVKKASHHSHGKHGRHGKYKNGHGGHHREFGNPPKGHYGSSNFNGGYSNNDIGFNNGYGPGNRLMSNTSFNRLIGMLAQESFDDDRLGIAKQALQNNRLNSEQVLLITSQFTFDESRLDFAKNAYSNTVDKENYFIINNEFAFSSTKESLNQYIYRFG